MRTEHHQERPAGTSPPVVLSKPTERPLSSDVMTVSELAERLAISIHGARNAIARGQVPGVVRLGRSVRISRRVIDRWLDEAGGAAGRA